MLCHADSEEPQNVNFKIHQMLRRNVSKNSEYEQSEILFGIASLWEQINSICICFYSHSHHHSENILISLNHVALRNIEKSCRNNLSHFPR